MEGMNVPMLSLIGGAIVWLAWLTLRMLSNETKIAVNTANDSKVSEQIQELKEDVNDRIDQLKTDMDKQFDKVFSKIENLQR